MEQYITNFASQTNAVSKEMSTAYSNFFINQQDSVVWHFVKNEVVLSNNKDYTNAVIRLGSCQVDYEKALDTAFIKDLNMEASRSEHLAEELKAWRAKNKSPLTDDEKMLLNKTAEFLLKHKKKLKSEVVKVSKIIVEGKANLDEMRIEKKDDRILALKRANPFTGEQIPSREVVVKIKEIFKGKTSLLKGALPLLTSKYGFKPPKEGYGK